MLLKWPEPCFYTSALLFTVVASVIGAGCSARLPLDAVVYGAPIRGQITVFVLTGTSPTAGVDVAVVAANGASQTARSSGVAATLGQAVFLESRAGTYQVEVADQPSQSPSTVPVTLTVGQPYASASLVVGLGSLSITSADGKESSYDETEAYHSYTITYLNPTDLQQDATVFYNPAASSLPSGWQVIFNSTVLKAGQSVPLVVQTAPWTVYGNVTITVSAVCDSMPLTSGTIVLTQHWQPIITVYYYQESCSYYWTYANFLCEQCSNVGNTIVESMTGAGGSCHPSGTRTLTDALTVPDGNGVAFEIDQSCIPTSLTFNTTFQNNISYTFTLPLSGCSWYYNNLPTTITAAMLN
jgi:hypothetical protein